MEEGILMTNYSKKEFKTLGKIEHTIIKLDETLGKMEDTDSKIKHFFEQEKAIFFEKVSAGYQSLFEREGNRIKRLDATQTPEHVFEQALSYLK